MKSPKHLSKWIVLFIILSIFIFTGFAIYLQFVTSVELSSTLIVSFYGFCTGELWLLASIKKTKINTPSNTSESSEDNRECVEEPQDIDTLLNKIKDMMQKGDE